MKNVDATSKKFSWPYPSGHRLLHSPSLVAVGLSLGYKTWPQIGWHHSFVIGLSKHRLELPSVPLHYGLKWPVGIPTVFQTPMTVPLHCNCLSFGLYKVNVKESTVVSHGRLLHNSLNRYHAEFFPEVPFPHSLIKQRKCQHTIIETVLLARNYKIKQSNEILSPFFTLHNHGPTYW